MNLVQEDTENSDRVYWIKFSVTPEECKELQAMAKYLYRAQAIERPALSRVAKAATFKFYNELNSVLLSGRARTQAEIIGTGTGTGTGTGMQTQ